MDLLTLATTDHDNEQHPFSLYEPFHDDPASMGTSAGASMPGLSWRHLFNCSFALEAVRYNVARCRACMCRTRLMPAPRVIVSVCCMYARDGWARV